MKLECPELKRGASSAGGMEEVMTSDSKRSPAAKVMDEAIDLAIEGRSPYPERAAFVDADAPPAGHDVERAADEGLLVVLVSADGSTRVLRPELQSTDSTTCLCGSHLGHIVAASPLGTRASLLLSSRRTSFGKGSSSAATLGANVETQPGEDYGSPED